MTIEITDNNYENIIKSDSKKVVLDFWAPRCGPCQIIGKHIDVLSEKYQNEILFGKINVDLNQDLSIKFGIRNIPTIVYLVDNKVIYKHVGLTSQNTIEEQLNRYMLEI